MDTIGKWKTKEYHIPTDNGIQVFVPDTLPQTNEDLAQTAQTLTEFPPDGTLNILLPVPEEAIKLVQSRGMECREALPLSIPRRGRSGMENSTMTSVSSAGKWGHLWS